MALQNSIIQKPKGTSISEYLNRVDVKGQIMQVVGKSSDRFVSSVVSAVNNNPDLQTCTKQSIMSAALLGESLKLSPSPQLGHFYMVPFDDRKKGRVATFQLGYKGYIQLALRSGYYKKINVVAIKEGELIRFDPLEEEIEVKLIEDEELRENAPTAGYYAFFEYLNGFKKAMYWSKKKMESHALKYSPGYAADKKKGTSWTFWSRDFDGMAFKTMLRQLISKWGIMSIELQTAFESDMSFKDENGQTHYTEEAPDVIDITPEPVQPKEPEQVIEVKAQEVPQQQQNQQEAKTDDVQTALFGDSNF